MNAADVADAVFSSIFFHAQHDPENTVPQSEAAQVLESIQAGLRSAGMSFAEYLERVRYARETSPQQSGQRWRFSARERTMQRVDNAVAQLCAIVKTLSPDF